MNISYSWTQHNNSLSGQSGISVSPQKGSLKDSGNWSTPLGLLTHHPWVMLNCFQLILDAHVFLYAFSYAVYQAFVVHKAGIISATAGWIRVLEHVFK